MRTTLLLSLLIAAAAPLSPVLAQQLIVVDDDGGPGTDHTTIQAAIDAAGPDDAILVRDGSYGAFQIDARSVAISGDAGADVQVAGMVIVINVAADQRVLLSGLDVADGLRPLFVAACSGPVVVEDSSFEVQNPVLFAGLAAGEVWSSDAVAFTSVLFRAQDGQGGCAGLVVEDSNLHLYECLVDGGTIGAGVKGSPGLRAIDSKVFASGSILRGGVGGEGTAIPPTLFCSDGADGGVGLAAKGTSSVRLLDTQLEGGAGGPAVSAICFDGSPGAPSSVDPGASITYLPAHPARKIVVPDVMREGESGSYEFEGSPGDLVFAVLGTSVSPTYLVKGQGTLVPGTPVVTVFSGILDASGTKSVPITVGSSLGADFALIHTQGLFVIPAEGYVLGTPRTSWLVAAGF